MPYKVQQKLHNTCQVEMIRNAEVSKITTVNFNHTSNGTYPNITNFYFELFKGPSKIPSNFAEYFPNLEAILWVLAGLKTISSDDLKPFPKVEILDFISNQIEFLESDLFVHTPNLLEIDFKSNKLQFVAPDLINGLHNLVTANFRHNTCIDVFASVDENDAFISMEELTKLFASDCSDHTAATSGKATTD